MSNEFTRTYVDSQGNSLKDSTYRIDRCEIFNVDGDSRDIRNMVAYIRITESLFSPSLVCEMGIRDEVNFIEEFGLSGNESIQLDIFLKALDIERELSFNFFVTTYSDYARGGKDTQVQAYTLTAVSEHAYIAPLKVISRTVSGTSTSIIKRIFEDDLNSSNVVLNGECGSSYKGQINIDNPLSATLDILNSASDVKRTPYFLYQDLSAQINVSSLSFLNDRDENPVYKEFTNKAELSSNPGTQEEFFERSTQMTKVTSRIGLSPTHSAKSGTFASENRYIDIAKKTYRQHIFNAALTLDPENTTSKKLNNFSTQAIADKRRSETESPLHRIPAANINYHYVNRNAFNGEKNINELEEEQSHISRSYLNGYDACTHQFSVLGDSFLNPGRTVKLLFPKATDPLIYREFTGKSITEFYDTVLSGNYMIFQSVHTFAEGKYQTDLTVKTDSLKQELEL